MMTVVPAQQDPALKGDRYRLAIGLEYQGTDYHGWQKQEGYASIQQAVEAALTQVADHLVEVTVAGRTDAGVHACGQVVHCDVAAHREDYKWLFGLNRYLPDAIRALWVKPVPVTFDARRSAIARSYRYIIYNHRLRPSILRNMVAWYFAPLDAEKMHQAAQYWVGSHDFSSFRAKDCQSRTPVREVFGFNVTRAGDFITIEVCANAFLHHMIRNFVGVLAKIGAGKAPIEHALQVLQACNRTKADNTAEASGLYLLDVAYPVEFNLPKSETRDLEALNILTKRTNL